MEVYTTQGHMTLLCGSKKEGIHLAKMLFTLPNVYKVKVRETAVPPIDLRGSSNKLVFEIV